LTCAALDFIIKKRSIHFGGCTVDTGRTGYEVNDGDKERRHRRTHSGAERERYAADFVASQQADQQLRALINRLAVHTVSDEDPVDTSKHNPELFGDKLCAARCRSTGFDTSRVLYKERSDNVDKTKSSFVRGRYLHPSRNQHRFHEGRSG
jgi:hypothetical protein